VNEPIQELAQLLILIPVCKFYLQLIENVYSVFYLSKCLGPFFLHLSHFKFIVKSAHEVAKRSDQEAGHNSKGKNSHDLLRWITFCNN